MNTIKFTYVCNTIEYKYDDTFLYLYVNDMQIAIKEYSIENALYVSISGTYNNDVYSIKRKINHVMFLVNGVIIRVHKLN